MASHVTLLVIGLGFMVGTETMLPGWWRDLPPPDASRWWLFGWPICLLIALWQIRRARPTQTEQNSANWLWPALFLLLFLASAPLFLFASSALLAQQAALLSALQVLPLILMLRKPMPPQGLVSLNGFALGALWLNALLFTDTPIWTSLICLLALSPLWLRLQPRAKPWLILTLTALVLAIIVLIRWRLAGQNLYFG